MSILTIEGVRLDGVAVALPGREEPNVEAPAIGIITRRIAESGVTPLDLGLQAARALFREGVARPDEFGAVISVSFTQVERMPAAAVSAQHALGLPKSVIAFDVNLACSGYGYGLYLAGLLAKSTGKKVLLLDGDVQSRFLDPQDVGTRAVLADGATASIVTPGGGGAWRFAFAADGSQGDLLTLSAEGRIRMNGFGVFKFVATDVVTWLREFLQELQLVPAELDAFVPHQANVYMVRQLASSLGVPLEKLWISGDVFGNLSSASVPATLAHAGRGGLSRVLLSGFGGGLSFFAALVDLPADCRFIEESR